MRIEQNILCELMNKSRNLNIIMHKQLLKDTFVFVGHGGFSEVAIKELNIKVFKL
jgi:hypothetical protein